MIIAQFPNGDWSELGGGDAIDFLDIDDGAREDIDSALWAKDYRVIASAQVRHEQGINRVQLNDGDGKQVRDGWPEPSVARGRGGRK